MTDILLGLGVIVFCIVCEGFFSGTETAMVSLDRSRIKTLADKGSKAALLIHNLLERPEQFFSTTLLGTNMVVVLSNAVATLMVIEHIGIQYEYLTIMFMSPLILVFGEIVPKTVYRYHAERIALRIILPFKVIAVIFYPCVVVFSWLTRLLVSPFGLESRELRPHTTREDIENYLDMWDINSRLRTAEKKMIERIFDFAETEVDDIMIRLVNIEAVEISDDLEKAVSLAQRTGYSRIPVYGGEAYNMIGILHAFDLLVAQGKMQTIKDVMRPARYVPNSMPIDELLKQMQTEGISIAVVVNEYGGTIGIITIEDILEEIVGEIYDEYDKEESHVLRIGKNKYLINARMEIDELNERLNLELPKDDYETVAGFMLKQMEKIPKTGESFQYDHVTFTVKQADRRSIKQVSIIITAPPKKAGSESENQ